MSGENKINLEQLTEDMALHISGGVSERSFSLAVTGGANPDFYRHWKSGRQSKRISADVFMNICREIKRDPSSYFDISLGSQLPSATVLTSAFAVLLDSLGIDPYEDARAQKLALSFPDVLKQAIALHDHSGPAGLPPPEEGPHAAA